MVCIASTPWFQQISTRSHISWGVAAAALRLAKIGAAARRNMVRATTNANRTVRDLCVAAMMIPFVF
jgi:hypothetical protein